MPCVSSLYGESNTRSVLPAAGMEIHNTFRRCAADNQAARNGSPSRSLTYDKIHKDQAWKKVFDWPTQTFATPEQPPLVWYKQLEVSPEIVNGERGPVLHLWTEQRLFFSSEYIEVLKTRSHDWVRNIGQRAQNHLAICCHQHAIGEHVAEILESQMPLSKAISRFRQCDVCLTAYAFFIREGHCKGSFQVILSTWTSLGSYRYSFSPA